jgi:WD40 repeat protein
MPLRLDIKRRLTARSDRVKSCDLHPTEQWMLVSLYNGNVHIWNYESQQLVKSFEVCELPVRAAVFVPRKNWVITGSDDMQVMINVFFCLLYRFKRKNASLWWLNNCDFLIYQCLNFETNTVHSRSFFQFFAVPLRLVSLLLYC